MQNKFFGYIPYNEAVLKKLWEESVFVLDANILLNLYRYSRETQEIVLENLKEIGNRLWIPYNTAEEFFNNRLKVIIDQKNIYNDIKKKINFNIIKDEINKIRHTTLSIRKNHMLDIVEECERTINSVIDEDQNNISEERKDLILDEILMLFHGNVGEKNSDKEIEDYIKIIDERYKKEIPPGYKDAKKPKEGRKYGDCINWFNVIKYAKENEKNVIYITDDNKEDWFLTINGIKYGPRNELLQEFHEKTGKIIYIYNTNEFVESFSRYIGNNNNININISNEIEEISKNNIEKENKLIDINLYKEEYASLFQEYQRLFNKYISILASIQLDNEQEELLLLLNEVLSLKYKLDHLEYNLGNKYEQKLYSSLIILHTQILAEVRKKIGDKENYNSEKQ